MRTMIQSERTTVPPVTVLKSLPAARITGALSPVIALSSIDATLPSGEEIRIEEREDSPRDRQARHDARVGAGLLAQHLLRK